MRYHQRLRAFYDSGHKLIMFAVVIAGSVAFSKILGDATPAAAAVAAVVAAIDLVWSPSHLARDHEILFRRFSDLAIDIRSGEQKHDKSTYVALVKQRISIETNEPPTYLALEASCDNEVRRAWGRTNKLLKIGIWSLLTMYFLRHSRLNFDEYSPQP